MWAWRSFLRRPNPVTTTRLQSALCRHDVTVHCRQSRRLISGVTIEGDSPHAEAPPSLGSDQERHLGRTAGQQHERTAAPAKRHLYVVLDDHKHDYGIYKLDVDVDADDVVSYSAQLLPHPAVLRVEVPTAIEDVAARFAALGSYIIILGCSPNKFGYHPENCMTYVYDTKTASLSVSCDGPKGLHCGYDDAVAVGGRLYAFESNSDACSGDMHCMSTVGRDGEDKTANRWPCSSWQPFSGSSRCFWSFDPHTIPFLADQITALAVHPSGSGFFASAQLWSYDDIRTFSYDTTSGQWAQEAGWPWQLPFSGHAAYDRELDALVGLHVADHPWYKTDGHLCACRVPSGDHRPPEWKVGGEKMLLEHRGWSHLDAKLVHMPERGEYCLVERQRRSGTEKCSLDGDECLLCLTTFRVDYGQDGELITAMGRRHARSYRVSRYRDDFEVAAFWI